MAKNVLKAWLVDNTVTADNKTDKIFQLETTRSIDKEIILDRMVAKNPGVRRETMALGIELMEEVVAEALMNGESVNTGLFRGVAQFRGVAKQNAWDAATNSIYVSLTQGKALREAIKDTRVDVLGERPQNSISAAGRMPPLARLTSVLWQAATSPFSARTSRWQVPTLRWVSP